jgi:hypothetical protein
VNQQAPAHTEERAPTTFATACCAVAMVSFLAAAVVVAVEVIGGHGTYGTRMVWLLAIVLPLLLLTVTGSWLVARTKVGAGLPLRQRQAMARLALLVGVLISIPASLIVLLLVAYGVAIAVHVL